MESQSCSDHVSETSQEHKMDLKREVGIIGGMSLVIGTIIGSGIFVSPGGVLIGSGSVGVAFIIWILGGITAILCALSLIELGTMFPGAGGIYIYLLEAFGAPFGFLFIWMNVFITKPASFGVITQAFASYAVEPFFQDEPGLARTPEQEQELWRITLAVNIGAQVAICAANCLSVKLALFIQKSLCFAKLVAMAIIIIGGIYQLALGKTVNFENPFEPTAGTQFSISSLALAFYSVLWAYDGWDQLNYATEEMKNPNRNLPLALLLGIPLITFIYILANISYLTLLTPEELVESKAVAVSWGQKFFEGNESMTLTIPYIMTAFVALSTFGAANGSLFSAGRIVFSGAREGHLPEILSYIHKRCATPAPALIFQTLISITFVTLMDINELINFFSFAAWIFYGGAFLALLVLRFTQKHKERPFKVWFVIPLIVTLLSVYLVLAPIIDDPAIQYIFVVIFAAFGFIFYIPFVHYKWRFRCLDSFNAFVRHTFDLSFSEKPY